MFATDQIFHLNLSICPAYVLGSPISRSWAGILAPPVALAGACRVSQVAESLVWANLVHMDEVPPWTYPLIPAHVYWSNYFQTSFGFLFCCFCFLHFGKLFDCPSIRKLKMLNNDAIWFTVSSVLQSKVFSLNSGCNSFLNWFDLIAWLSLAF